VLQSSRENELLVLRGRLPPGQRSLDFRLDLVELSVGLCQHANHRPPRGFVVGLLDEVHVLFELSQDHPGEAKGAIGGDLHRVDLAVERSRDSGCRKSCSQTSAGIETTSAPIRAASSTWTGFFKSATRICVWNP